MLKIIVACLGVFLGLVSPASATEVQPKSLVVVDTGFDTQLPIFQDRVITEVCILDWSRCPNRSNFQEGVGSAFLPRAISQFNGFFHGTQMASIALAQDSTIKVILIRIIADSQSGFRLPVQDSNISQVLEWVINNRDKFNIGAVAMAQGHPGLNSLRDYCPKISNVEKKIIELKRLDIPFVVPAGNEADKAHINWPACIPSALAIGASTKEDLIASYTNIDRNLVDFYALGSSDSTMPGGKITPTSGTSVSTIVAATNWVTKANKYPSMSYAELYQYFRGGPIIFDEKYNYGRKMLLESPQP
jgi:hypothetical protein